jgi:2-oxo-4-hydroxy-4-carboxy--5-ureidoimidazoline (OHCU) decarboxylase
MPVNKLPPILEFHTCSDLTQTDVLDTLFEPSPAIHATLIPVIRTAVYSTWSDLIDACQIRLLSLATSTSTSSPDPTLLSVLGSHPRLGEKKITSEQSAAEQANLQSDGGKDSSAEAEELARLNRQYEETFPGLRYVVFVNGRGRRDIKDDMRARIARADYTKEVDAALQVGGRYQRLTLTPREREC